MKYNQFSMNEYSKILETYKDRFVTFNNNMPDNFVLLRHDVEFSVNRALLIAEFETNKNVSSSFFFQVYSNAYNPFSADNILKIKRIKSLGHEVGLHLYVSHIQDNNYKELVSELNKQKNLFEKGLSLKCNVFSIHRPPNWILKYRSNNLGEMLNTYGESFFEFSKKPNQIKYISDSQHKWAYGHPLDKNNFSKLQILLHPDEWSSKGDSSEKEFFNKIINEHNQQFINTLDTETKHFSKYKEDN